MTAVVGVNPFRAVYVVVFGTAAVACFVSVFRAEQIDTDDIRRGLVWLLVTSGLWASAHVARIIVPTASLKITFYLLGLSVGFAAPFAWLYFCSAYTGRPYHRLTLYRQGALALYLGVLLIKFTNPLHGLYFTATFTPTPFPHLAISLDVLHWIVTGVAYALSAIGFYMLLELFTEINYDTTTLGILVALTGLPVVLDLIGYLNPGFIIALNYEPLGVAAFAVGVLYVIEPTFLAIPQLGRRQLIDNLDEIILFVDTDNQLMDVNTTARNRFGDGHIMIGDPVTATVPALEDPMGMDGSIITLDQADGDTSPFYLVKTIPLIAGETAQGHAIVLTDVSELERHRQELKRQNDQLDGFAAAVAHELNNAVSLISGNIELIRDSIQTGDTTTAEDRIETVSETTRSMSRVVDDLVTIAQLSKTVEEPPLVDFNSAIKTAVQGTASLTTECTVKIIGDGQIRVEPKRLKELVKNLGEIAEITAANTLQFEKDGGLFTVTLDGESIEVAESNKVFEYGTAVPNAQLGMRFANIQALSRAHGWTVDIVPGYADGIKLRIAGIRSK